MSLLQHLFNDSSVVPESRILDQHFGIVLEPEDFMQPITVPTLIVPSSAGYVRTWRSSASKKDHGSTISFDKHNFQACLDVRHFKPDEIDVKINSNNIVRIEGEHKEQQDEHGRIYRHFIRRYILPKNCDMKRVKSKLSLSGILTITALRLEENKDEDKILPVTKSDEEPVEQKEETCDKNLGEKARVVKREEVE